jgi:hypothetical protein
MFIYLLINRINAKYFIVNYIFAFYYFSSMEKASEFILLAFPFYLKIYEYWHT